MFRPTGASQRRNDMRGGDGLGQIINDFIHARTSAMLIRIDEFAGNQRHIFGLSVQTLS